MKWNAIRIIITVIASLVLGYFITFFFNLDSANIYEKGKYKIILISSLGDLKSNTKIQVKKLKGGNFNKPRTKKPLKEKIYEYKALKGEKLSVLVFAANRRSKIDLEVEIYDPNDKNIIFKNNATDEEIKKYKKYRIRNSTDVIIDNITLLNNGNYKIKVKPETIKYNIIISEALKSTNKAYKAFLLGPIERINRWAIWIQDALTLILVGLSIAIVFRAEQFSLGAEGQLYLGALVSGIIALTFSQLPAIILIPFCILGAMMMGFIWGLIPGILKAYLGANELVATLMLNTVAIKFYEMVLTMQLKPPEAGYISSDIFSKNAQLPSIIENTQITIAVYIVILAVLFTWLLITRTPLGYEIRMVGANSKFSEYGGINTKNTIMLTIAISGIVAGLAGAHLSMGIFRQLISGISFGLAFEGVVVALLARNNPLVIPFTGLLYAYLRAGAQFMERDANISFEIVKIIQAVIILLITAEALSVFFSDRNKKKILS